MSDDLIWRKDVLALTHRLGPSLDADDGYFVSVNEIRAIPTAADCIAALSARVAELEGALETTQALAPSANVTTVERFCGYDVMMALDGFAAPPSNNGPWVRYSDYEALTTRAEAAEAKLATAWDDGIEASHDIIQRVADGYAAGGDGAIACALYLTAGNVRAMKGGA